MGGQPAKQQSNLERVSVTTVVNNQIIFEHDLNDIKIDTYHLSCASLKVDEWRTRDLIGLVTYSESNLAMFTFRLHQQCNLEIQIR